MKMETPIGQLTGGLTTSDAAYATTLANNIKSQYQHTNLVLITEWSKNGESYNPE